MDDQRQLDERTRNSRCSAQSPASRQTNGDGGRDHGRYAVAAWARAVLRSRLRPEWVMPPVVRAFGTLAITRSRPALVT
jgi:hypothetical protein